MQDRLALGVAELDLAEARSQEAAACRRRRLRSRPRDPEGAPSTSKIRSAAGQRALHGLPLVAQRGERLEEALQEQHERGQRADRDVERASACACRPTAGTRPRAPRGSPSPGRRWPSRTSTRLEAISPRCRTRRNSATKPAARPKAWITSSAAQRLLEVRGDRPDRGAVAPLGVAHAHLEEPRHEHERRHDERGDELRGRLRATIAAAIVTSRTRFASTRAALDENTASSVSTSAVQRLMTSPSGCGRSSSPAGAAGGRTAARAARSGRPAPSSPRGSCTANVASWTAAVAPRYRSARTSKPSAVRGDQVIVDDRADQQRRHELERGRGQHGDRDQRGAGAPGPQEREPVAAIAVRRHVGARRRATTGLTRRPSPASTARCAR